MTLLSIFVVAIALSLDAFGVALSIGINSNIKFKNKVCFCISFSFFQTLFTLMGSCGSLIFNKYINYTSSILGGIIVAVVGVTMILEGMEEKNKYIFLKPKMCILLGISVSIDALVIGFTFFETINSLMLLIEISLFIGIVTFILTSIAFIISVFFRKVEFICKYADYIGGIILIILGLKLILSR
ncbi:manganese efflux pump MntP [Clostridium algidicarnis]|uniref:manganese efflux pump MntP n=1 Tax=Clostridium algidicarnis TaxID=37659 RepID=UPI001C0ACD1D|nr:manganese efflux pump [Clostridium algidicarnis]MBU3196170.1 manganese efflux pump [Clostridium algidicarnis]MBU3209212.1 manganese efflux pump [Clostridium algidicarnis]MBU3228861.1 manganese efflux pump [Clostridium algidicarnis]MBU3252421.1 manganese efflux pump [Clostridium algidicarnis]